jgi:3-isopropylmalate/(R)-2-methylmalate dehydratase small subunit
MANTFSGRAHVYGDDIDTDRIIPGKYTKTLDLQSLADHVLEDLDPEFRARLAKGDLLVAGTNFGCGSSREQAPLALKVAGVSAVVAKYFARIFFRNAINIGLPVMEVSDLEADTGDELEIDLTQGTLRNVTKDTTHHASPMPGVMIDILNEGGLVAYLKKHGSYDQSSL